VNILTYSNALELVLSTPLESRYGTGLTSPRAICATGSGSDALNKVLGPAFKLAYASEDLIRLVDTTDMSYIKDRVKGYDAAIIGTAYQLERRAVTLNTYEKTPNDKTYEFYLDQRYGAIENDVPSDDSEIHQMIFTNSVRACKEAGISHIVAIETPKTVNRMDYLNVLDNEGVAYTYIRTNSPMKKDITFTFEKGISSKLGVSKRSKLLASIATPNADDGTDINREDIAALVVQSLMSLDWAESRIFEVHNTGVNVSSGYGEKETRGQKYDKQWCPNSDLLADALSSV
jgi:hypothetical protein